MRLINAKTLELEEFYGTSIPGYAILSHTWGLQKDEVSFQDWQFHKLEASNKPGFFKINATCEQALLNDLDYAWVDTICIDKSSSSELSEAINSMFAWYRNAVVCYVYLSDVSKKDGDSFPKEQFRASRWFKRGWTLQELLAPSTAVFYSCEWNELGTKSNLRDFISDITEVEPHYLLSTQYMTHASVAEKMCWASGRTTTRAEDLAYCLLGIFDITMPLLYGEGNKAFLRLQEEILKVSPDHTIFCWSWIDEYVPHNWGSVLAPCPSVFRYSKDFEPISHSSPHSMTNTGLSIEVRLIEGWFCHFVVLTAKKYEDNRRTNVCIPVISCFEGSYARIRGPTVQPLSIPVYWISRFPKQKILIESKMVMSHDPFEKKSMELFKSIGNNYRPYNSRNDCYMLFDFNENSSSTSMNLDVGFDRALIQRPGYHQNADQNADQISLLSDTLGSTKAFTESDGPSNLLSFLIAFKTPGGKFRMLRPTFRIKVWDKIDTRTIGGLIRVTSDHLNCVIFIGQKARPPRPGFENRICTVWYCGVLQHTAWGTNRKARATLLRDILDQIAKTGTESRTSFCGGKELENEISMVQILASSRSLPSLALGDWSLREKNVRYSLALQERIKIETYRLHTS